MEATGKCRMFCKLLCSVLCFSVILESAQSSSVVSFNQNNAEFASEKRAKMGRLLRQKRSSETVSERNDNKCEDQKSKFEKAVANGNRLETRHVFANESKFNLALAWAGKNDDGVLVVLTCETDPRSESASTLWRSKDFGRTWKDISSKVNNKSFRNNGGLQRNPHESKWIYLIGSGQYLYTSEDGGDSWTAHILPDMVRDELIFHSDDKYKDHIMVITRGNKLLMTRNNFKTFDIVHQHLAHRAVWGTKVSGTATNMFMAYGQDIHHSFFPFLIDDRVAVFELWRRSADGDSWTTVKKNVADFGMQGDFLYASVYKSEKPDSNSDRLMVVSNDAGNTWNEAQLPTITSDRFFSVLDMSESLVFMHVDEPGDTGHGTLYTSWSKGIVFSESLQRHLYPNYNSITDFYRVYSMRGTYIASQLASDNSIHSVITFDMGGEWHKISKPDNVKCKDGETECFLQIHNSYSRHRGVNAHPPVSEEDAVGLILVNAHVAKNLQITPPDVFLSSDGGYSWRKVLDGPHSYVIADSGGLIVAISLETQTPKEVKFSTDEGRCWHVYEFTNETIHHTGLLTEPGSKSMTVAMWGYRLSDKKWTVNIIDFADVVKDHCTNKDYESWQPHESMKKETPAQKSCLLGQREQFQRLKADSWCHNGYDYKPEKSAHICPCASADFECDYGYYRPGGKEECVKQPDFSGPEIDVCVRGHTEKVISEGYRKLPGDVCNEQDGFRPSSKYIDLGKICKERIIVEPMVKVAEKEGGSYAVLISLGVVGLIVLALALAYFGYKMVLLRRHKVVYRYSMLNQGTDKDYDEEIERTLTGLGPQPVFGDSDEEELPVEPPHNGNMKKYKRQMKGYHDDSDDDMLN